MKKDEIKQKRPFAPGIQWQLMLFIGGMATYTFVWDLGDVGVGLMTIFNMIALIPLAPKALASLREYEQMISRRKAE